MTQEVELHAAEDRGVVDQVVDAAELRKRLRGHLLGRVGVGDVDPHGERVAALTLDAVGDLLRALGVDVGHHDGRTLARQRLGVGLADAATGAGDDGHLVVELISVRSQRSVLRSSEFAMPSRSQLWFRVYSSKPATPISRPIPDCL